MKTFILVIALLCTGCANFDQNLRDYNRAMGVFGTCTTVKNGNTFTTRCTEAPR